MADVSALPGHAWPPSVRHFCFAQPRTFQLGCNRRLPPRHDPRLPARSTQSDGQPDRSKRAQAAGSGAVIGRLTLALLLALALFFLVPPWRRGRSACRLRSLRCRTARRTSENMQIWSRHASNSTFRGKFIWPERTAFRLSKTVAPRPFIADRDQYALKRFWR
jgi:hypothetical protein